MLLCHWKIHLIDNMVDNIIKFNKEKKSPAFKPHLQLMFILYHSPQEDYNTSYISKHHLLYSY